MARTGIKAVTGIQQAAEKVFSKISEGFATFRKSIGCLLSFYQFRLVTRPGLADRLRLRWMDG